MQTSATEAPLETRVLVERIRGVAQLESLRPRYKLLGKGETEETVHGIVKRLYAVAEALARVPDPVKEPKIERDPVTSYLQLAEAYGV